MELSELGCLVDSAISYYTANNLAVFDKYVIMPNHIHMIIAIPKETGDRGRSPLQIAETGDRGRSPLQIAEPGDRGRSPLQIAETGDRGRSPLQIAETGDRGRSPLQQIVRNLKSYVTRMAGFSPWQKSFHDHIIRDETEYHRIWKYIDDNPTLWTEDLYYVNA